MRAKMGTIVPKKGTTVQIKAAQTRYREAVAAALRTELGQTHQAIKTAMRWTGASERAVKYWLSGERGTERRASDRADPTLRHGAGDHSGHGQSADGWPA